MFSVTQLVGTLHYICTDQIRTSIIPLMTEIPATRLLELKKKLVNVYTTCDAHS
jgi:hypothetical protein